MSDYYKPKPGTFECIFCKIRYKLNNEEFLSHEKTLKCLSSPNAIHTFKKLKGFALNIELARKAGKKGGENLSFEKRSFFKNKEAARSAGAKGNKVRKEKMILGHS